MAAASDRVETMAQIWRVALDDRFETATSWMAFGRCGDRPVVLKVLKAIGDEWQSGGVLAAFGGRGVARVLEHVDGALLIERLRPAHSLVSVATGGRDDEATTILADVIARMSPVEPTPACSTVQDWVRSFERYRSSGDRSIPIELVEEAERTYLDLCATQRRTRLLHGDLHHYNVLFDGDRGWTAIDPKGVIGELEYETGAILRNPIEVPALFLSPARIDARLDVFTSRLNLDRDRMLAWGFAQAVLSAIWTIEDGCPPPSAVPFLTLATVMRPMRS